MNEDDNIVCCIVGLFVVGLFIAASIVIPAGREIGKRTLKEDTSKPMAKGKAISSTVASDERYHITLYAISHDNHLWVPRGNTASSPVHHPSCPCFAPAAR